MSPTVSIKTLLIHTEWTLLTNMLKQTLWFPGGFSFLKDTSDIQKLVQIMLHALF
jgi:hypothetical protein